MLIKQNTIKKISTLQRLSDTLIICIIINVVLNNEQILLESTNNIKLNSE